MGWRIITVPPHGPRPTAHCSLCTRAGSTERKLLTAGDKEDGLLTAEEEAESGGEPGAEAEEEAVDTAVEEPEAAARPIPWRLLVSKTALAPMLMHTADNMGTYCFSYWVIIEHRPGRSGTVNRAHTHTPSSPFLVRLKSSPRSTVAGRSSTVTAAAMVE